MTEQIHIELEVKKTEKPTEINLLTVAQVTDAIEAIDMAESFDDAGEHTPKVNLLSKSQAKRIAKALERLSSWVDRKAEELESVNNDLDAQSRFEKNIGRNPDHVDEWAAKTRAYLIGKVNSKSRFPRKSRV